MTNNTRTVTLPAADLGLLLTALLALATGVKPNKKQQLVLMTNFARIQRITNSQLPRASEKGGER